MAAGTTGIGTTMAAGAMAAGAAAAMVMPEATAAATTDRAAA